MKIRPDTLTADQRVALIEDACSLANTGFVSRSTIEITGARVYVVVRDVFGTELVLFRSTKSGRLTPWRREWTSKT